MDTLQQKYSRPFIFALLLHAILLTALFIDLNFPSQPKLAADSKSAVNIVKAVAVDQSKVQQEMNRISEERQQKQAAEERRQRKMAEQAERAVQKRKAEQAKFKHLQQQLKHAEQQRLAEKAAAEKQLEKIKKQQIAENKRLAKIKEQQKELNEKQKQEADLEAKQKAAQVAAEQRKKELEKQVQDEEKQAQEETLSSQQQSEIDKYKALVINAIQNNWNYPDNVTDDMTCLLQIKLGPGGVVLKVAVIRSSGNNLLDRSAEVAVYKASPLPVPSDPVLFDKFRQLNLKVRPKGKVSV